MSSLTTKEKIIILDEHYYSQIDRVAIDSPLAPISAIIFLLHYKNKWLKNCSKAFKLLSYKRYVDDISVLFEKLKQVLPFVNYINKT